MIPVHCKYLATCAYQFTQYVTDIFIYLLYFIHGLQNNIFFNFTLEQAMKAQRAD
jgi:hypothetical protein